MNPGDTKQVTIGQEEAYGPHREEMVAVVARENLPDDVPPNVGQRLEVQQPDGQVIPAWIAAVSDSAITLDANHPLAGKELTFELQLVEIV
jgi:peptidylprolyl isomerase